MAKKTSKKKTSAKRKATTKRSSAVKSKAAGKKKTPSSKAAAVSKADTDGKSAKKKKTTRKSASGSAAGAKTRKSLTAKSSASAALAAIAAFQSHQHNNGHDAEDAVEWTEAKLRKVKTGLKKKDLEHFRELLIEKRTEILGDVASIQSANSGGAGNLSNMPLHMADVGSDNYEQEFALGLVEWERKLLNEIDNAIERIDRGYYGVCLESGAPIPRERLEIKPWAKYTIDVVRERERRGLPT